MDENGYAKTSVVAKILEKTIVLQSEYKKTPRIPVYASFKVLVKENKFRFDEMNSHKYLLNVPKTDFLLWVENL